MLRPFLGSALAPPQIPHANRHSLMFGLHFSISHGFTNICMPIVLICISLAESRAKIHYVDSLIEIQHIYHPCITSLSAVQHSSHIRIADISWVPSHHEIYSIYAWAAKPRRGPSESKTTYWLLRKISPKMEKPMPELLWIPP